jgi:hypothetical protein
LHTFNAAYFSTTALVIPVLLLSFAVQSDFLTRLVLAIVRRAQRASLRMQDSVGKQISFRHDFIGSIKVVLFHLAAAIGLGILAFGILAEVDSLLALEDRSASTSTEHFVFVMCVILTSLLFVAFTANVIDTAKASTNTP